MKAKPVFLICPYKMGSASGRNLREILKEYLGYEIVRVSPEHVLHSNEWLINWGNGHLQGKTGSQTTNARVFNIGANVCLSINKIDFLRTMTKAKIPTLKWTTSPTTALSLVETGDRLYCRHQVEGRDGRGIEVCENPNQLPVARLYTVGVPSTCEYRIHVFRGKPIFDLIKQNKTKTIENSIIRSGEFGWFYSRDCVAPDNVRDIASQTCDALGLDFCAVDILYNAKSKEATVLESNTAPELGPWTRKAYAKKFLALLP